VNGQANARGIAHIHAILANGGVAKGRRFMSEAGCRKALELQVEGPDLIMPFPARFGLGYALPGTGIPLQFPSPNIAFWGGHGGSFVVADFDRRMSFGYAMNKMGPSTVGDARSYAIIRAVWEALAA
jgi:CubicO group peptidase (beta-lactamase class C family)